MKSNEREKTLSHKYLRLSEQGPEWSKNPFQFILKYVILFLLCFESLFCLQHFFEIIVNRFRFFSSRVAPSTVRSRRALRIAIVIGMSVRVNVAFVFAEGIKARLMDLTRDSPPTSYPTHSGAVNDLHHR